MLKLGDAFDTKIDAGGVSNFSQEDHDSQKDGNSYHDEEEIDDSSVHHGGVDVGDSKDDQSDDVGDVEFL